MIFNKIFVLGAGAIGSVYGASLSNKNDVTLIGNKAHVDAVNTSGLSISG
ncbi:2-dehydropantoate 2-reductase, partial [Candidatus Bathyarchaeota archaeon]|nr:2-dehydropantoate 2-reductase [Candidatus Bathyarchaeota archaeon]